MKSHSQRRFCNFNFITLINIKQLKSSTKGGGAGWKKKCLCEPKYRVEAIYPAVDTFMDNSERFLTGPCTFSSSELFTR